LKSKQTGNIGEGKICELLIRLGFTICCRNFHGHQGELDIIATKQERFYFFEVKLRSGSASGFAVETVNSTKRFRIMSTVQEWLMKNEGSDDDIGGIYVISLDKVENVYFNQGLKSGMKKSYYIDIPELESHFLVNIAPFEV